jgi:hypothetical protein
MTAALLELVEDAKEGLVVGHEGDFVEWDFAEGCGVCIFVLKKDK